MERLFMDQEKKLSSYFKFKFVLGLVLRKSLMENNLEQVFPTEVMLMVMELMISLLVFKIFHILYMLGCSK